MSHFMSRTSDQQVLPSPTITPMDAGRWVDEVVQQAGSHLGSTCADDAQVLDQRFPSPRYQTEAFSKLNASISTSLFTT